MSHYGSSLLWSEIISPLAHVLCTLCIHMYYANAMADFITIHVWYTQSICFVTRQKYKRSYIHTCVRAWVRACVCSYVRTCEDVTSNCPVTIRLRIHTLRKKWYSFEWLLVVDCSFFYFFFFFFIFFFSNRCEDDLIWR